MAVTGPARFLLACNAALLLYRNSAALIARLESDRELFFLVPLPLAEMDIPKEEPMPEVGIEPTRGRPHASLSRARLPVPPLRHTVQGQYTPEGAGCQIDPHGAIAS
jgi:hypothetical protein